MRFPPIRHTSRNGLLVLAYCLLATLVGGLDADPPTSATVRCPDGYLCSWLKDAHSPRAPYYLDLQCKTINSERGFAQISTYINASNLPSNTSRLNIRCYGQIFDINLKIWFGKSINVTHLSLKDISLQNKTLLALPNIGPKLLSLSLDNVDIKHLKFDYKEVGTGSLPNLRSMTLKNIVTLKETIHDQLFQRNYFLEYLHLDNIASNIFKITIDDFALAIRDLLYNHRAPVRILIMNRIQKTRGTFSFTKFFYQYSNRKVKTFDLRNNLISDVIGDPIFHLPNLEKLNIANNIFEKYSNQTTFWSNIIRHPTLKELDISNTTSNKKVDSHLKLKFKCPFDKEFITTKFGLNYRLLNMRNSIFLDRISIQKKTVCMFDQNTIHYIDLTGSRSTSNLELVLALPSLEYLSLQDTNLIMSQENIFSLYKNIKVLLLGNNDLGEILHSHPRLFANNHKLTTLDISNCNVKEHIPTDLLSPLKMLTHLNLSSNPNLKSVTDIDFKILENLKFINLSTTGIKEFDSSVLDTFTKLPNLNYDMSNMNELICNDALKRWLPTTLSNRVIDNDFYKFANIKNTFCKDKSGKVMFSELRRINYVGVKWVKLLQILISTILITSIIGALVWYRYRWKLQLFIHKTKKKFQMQVISDKNTSEYVYDVFVCYNRKDRDWVTTTLVPNVESKGLTTLVHERDYLPGAVIQDAIVESLTSSRFVLFVITTDFLESDWCMTELRMAKEESVSRVGSSSKKGAEHEMLIPVILSEDFSMSEIDKAGILNRSFLQWPSKKCQGHSDKLALFWDKLITKLSSGGNIRK